MGAERTQPPRPCGPGSNGKQSSGGLLTADDLAARWRVPKSQVYRMAREGRIPTVRLGRYYRFEPASIERFEAEGGSAADG